LTSYGPTHASAAQATRTCDTPAHVTYASSPDPAQIPGSTFFPRWDSNFLRSSWRNLSAALQQVLPAIQPQQQLVPAPAPDTMDALHEALRKIRIDGVNPLDAADQGSAYRSWVMGVERDLFQKHRLLEIIKGEFACPPGAANDPEVTDWQIRNTRSGLAPARVDDDSPPRTDPTNPYRRQDLGPAPS